ncbi:hypothetical protein EVAR_31853_1 [Eumeta japonica]|uniref:Uncharacterized protein n=1 Tax=Eumeta variegata TaxID=151549 RepID=A0A4C1Z7D7_EUMVA|nr:hypothetical protein EVAR_31853_1 [Eumeta japonica]
MGRRTWMGLLRILSIRGCLLKFGPVAALGVGDVGDRRRPRSCGGLAKSLTMLNFKAVVIRIYLFSYAPRKADVADAYIWSSAATDSDHPNACADYRSGCTGVGFIYYELYGVLANVNFVLVGPG